MGLQKIYEKIAENHGTTAEEVRAEMDAAIRRAWENPDKLPEETALQLAIRPDGTTPTPEELIVAIAQKLTEQKETAR